MKKHRPLPIKIKYAFAPVLVAVVLLSAGCDPQSQMALSTEQSIKTEAEETSSVSIFAMDTIITMEAYGGEENAAIGEAESLMFKLDGLWSVTDVNSEIYKANHSQGTATAISEETEQLVTFALKMAEETDGALNPGIYPVLKAWGFTTKQYRIPKETELTDLLSYTDYRKIQVENGNLSMPAGMEIDFGAVAKGYAGDLAADIMREYGVPSAIINLGGNVSLIGSSPDGQPWTVGIRSPYGEGNIGTLEASDCNIITSGGYERYFIGEDGKTYWHILDPENGKPADKGLISVTIVGKEGRLCDALSTAMFVMGKNDAEAYWKSHEGFEMILITEDNEIYLTEGLERGFQLNEASQGIPVKLIIR